MTGATSRDGGRRRRCSAASLALAGALAITAVACLPRIRRPPAVDAMSVYTCPGDFRFSVRELGEVATINLPMRTISIPRVRTASGARYAAEGAELRIQGPTATLTVGGERHADCAGQRVESAAEVARMLGVDYRAVGHEPGWSLEIDSGRYLRFMIEGSTPMYMPVPEPTGDTARRVYRGASGSMTLEVIIEEKSCRDPTITAPLVHTVTVHFNGIPYRGCGEPLGGP